MSLLLSVPKHLNSDKWNLTVTVFIPQKFYNSVINNQHQVNKINIAVPLYMAPATMHILLIFLNDDSAEVNPKRTFCYTLQHTHFQCLHKDLYTKVHKDKSAHTSLFVHTCANTKLETSMQTVLHTHTHVIVPRTTYIHTNKRPQTHTSREATSSHEVRLVTRK